MAKQYELMTVFGISSDARLCHIQMAGSITSNVVRIVDGHPVNP